MQLKSSEVTHLPYSAGKNEIQYIVHNGQQVKFPYSISISTQETTKTMIEN